MKMRPMKTAAAIVLSFAVHCGWLVKRAQRTAASAETIAAQPRARASRCAHAGEARAGVASRG